MYSSISYQIKFSNSKKMDELIGRLDDEATANFQIVKVSHSKIQEFRKQLKIEAVKQAKQKGLYLTEAIGEKLGEAITINEPDESRIYPSVINSLANTTLNEVTIKARGINGLNVDKDFNTAIDFRKIKLKYDVTILFALK